MKDSLGDRMKSQYEDRTRIMLPRRTYTIIRVDGRAFHSWTRGLPRPCVEMHLAMDAAASRVLQDGHGGRLAYLQSDECSFLLTDFTNIHTEAWFDANLQKLASVAASMFTAQFNLSWAKTAGYAWDKEPATFDARVFTIPDRVEVENYFIWRQQDAVRNSIQSLAQSKCSHKSLQGLNTDQLQEKLFQEAGINWADLPVDQKRGRAITPTAQGGGWRVDLNIPTFTQDRAFLRQFIPEIWPAEMLKDVVEQ